MKRAEIVLLVAIIILTLTFTACGDDQHNWAFKSATVLDNLGNTSIYRFPTWGLESDSGEVRPVVFCNLPPIWKGMHGDFYFIHHTSSLDMPACDELLSVKRDFRELKK
jgi:hypothetical protein